MIKDKILKAVKNYYSKSFQDWGDYGDLSTEHDYCMSGVVLCVGKFRYPEKLKLARLTYIRGNAHFLEHFAVSFSYLGNDIEIVVINDDGCVKDFKQIFGQVLQAIVTEANGDFEKFLDGIESLKTIMEL